MIPFTAIPTSTPYEDDFSTSQTELPQVTTNLIKKQTNKQSVFYA